MLHELKSNVRQFRLQHETYVWFTLEIAAVTSMVYGSLKLLVVLFSIVAGDWSRAILGVITAVGETALVMMGLVLCLTLPLLIVDSLRSRLTSTTK